MEKMPAIEYKRNFTEVVSRHQALRRARTGSLILTTLPEEDAVIAAGPRVPPLEELDFAADPLRLARLTCDRAEVLFPFKAGYPDDSIPAVSLRFGSGVVAGMVTGTLRFGSDTSWIESHGNSLKETLDFPTREENEWIDLVVNSLNYTARRMADRCYVMPPGYHSPLEFASLVRGSGLYLDMYTEPDSVQALLARSDEVLWKLYRKLDERIDYRQTGILAVALWMEKGLPFLSDDSAGLISPEHYRKFGVPSTNGMFRRYGGGFLHVHTQAYHQRDNLSLMDGLTVYNWRQDPNTAPVHEILDRILPGAQDKIVMVVLTPEQVRRNAGLLSQGRFIIQAPCTDKKEQQALIEFVRAHLPIA